MVAHPKRPTRHQGPYTLPKNLQSQDPHRRPCSQPQAHPQTKCGAIFPLCGTDFSGRGTPRSKTQHHGRHQFLPGTTVSDLHKRSSSLQKSMPPPRLHPPLHVINCSRQLAERKSNHRPHLDRFLLPPPPWQILHGWNRHSLHPLHPSRNPVLCGNPTHPSHQILPLHLSCHHLC